MKVNLVSCLNENMIGGPYILHFNLGHYIVFYIFLKHKCIC